MGTKTTTLRHNEVQSEAWKRKLLEDVVRVAADHDYWRTSLQEPGRGVHLAVLVEPYLQYILEGRKTVESRFSANRCAPYKQVNKRDVVLLKKVGGPVVGVCEVSHVWFYDLDPSSWQEIRTDFTKALCAQDPEFWQTREHTSYATLMRVEQVTALEPFSCDKRDRRGWVVVREAATATQLSMSPGIFGKEVGG